MDVRKFSATRSPLEFARQTFLIAVLFIMCAVLLSEIPTKLLASLKNLLRVKESS